MNLLIKNCNNIEEGLITVEENKLNIKYAINGTGKTTVAKAIEFSIKHDDRALKELIPFKYIDDSDKDHQPTIEGLPDDLSIATFDEKYVSQYVFLEDELLMNSFEIFVKTVDYDEKIAEIDELISDVRTLFENNPDLNSLLQDINEFISVFGRDVRNGIASNSVLVKGMSSGNLIQNIPEGLEDYTVFLTDEQNSNWLKWQASGRGFMKLGNVCPFCAGGIEERRKIIERIENEYDAKTVEHLSRILGLFEKLLRSAENV